MSFGRKAKKQVVHRADDSAHDRYSAMGAIADFGDDLDELDEPIAPVSVAAIDEVGCPDERAAFDSDAVACDPGVRAAFNSDAVEPLDSDEEAASVPTLPASFARFRRLYESRDGKMAVFEDEHGHLIAVDAQRLV